MLAWYDAIFAPFSHAPLAAFGGLGAVVCGFLVAQEMYRNATEDPLPALARGFSHVLRHRFYFDEIYQKLIAVVQEGPATFLAAFDRWMIGGVAVRGVYGTVEICGRLLRLVQTGNLQTYSFFFGVGVVALLYFVFLR